MSMTSNEMILALESSCDETAVALFDPRVGLCGEWINSQIALHGRHGGVVPDLATREHLRNFAPLLTLAQQTEPWTRVSSVAVTKGPGLAACLAIGVSTAKAIALAKACPLLGVNHLRGHVWSPFIALHASAPLVFEERLQALLPHLGLIVSGGNTLLFRIGTDRSVSIISSTRDDAAGEALDKGAKLLGLGYPGGPLIEKTAFGGKVDAYDFPRGLGPKSDLDFSFSGLKTSLRYQIEKMTETQVSEGMADLCASYQQAVIDALVRKAGIALQLGTGEQAYQSVGLSGGVANNQRLRSQLGALCEKRRVAFYAALPKHTGDNAGMIAFASWVDAKACDSSGMAMGIDPSLEI